MVRLQSHLALLALAAGTSTASAKQVFAHVMFGEVNEYTVEDHANDMRIAASVGIDAFAINSGHDTYGGTCSGCADLANVDKVLAAAKETGFKWFFSFDLLHYNQPNASNWIRYDYMGKYGKEDSYAKIDGEPLSASSFEDANKEWNTLLADLKSDGLEAYYAPFWLSTNGIADADLELNAVGNWFFAGEIGENKNVTAEADQSWKEKCAARGVDYWAPMGAGFSVHQVSDRNYVYSGGDFLLPTHYESVINLGDEAPDYIEFITWSDWGESTYIGPLNKNASPPSETIDTAAYVDGHDHLPYAKLSAYWNHWYKSGSPPDIKSEAIFCGHPLDVKPSNDPLPKPGGASALSDTIYVVVFVPPGSSASRLVVTTGGKADGGRPVSEGVNYVMVPFVVGETGVSLQDADNKELLSGAGQTIIDNPEIWDFNYYSFSVPAEIEVSDFLGVDFSSGSSSSSGASSSSGSGDVTTTRAPMSGMVTSVTSSARSRTSDGASTSATESSSDATSTASNSWWVAIPLAFAFLMVSAYMWWRNRSLTSDSDSEEQSDSWSSSSGSSRSRRSSLSSDSGSSSDSSSSSRHLYSLARPPRRLDRRPAGIT
ncbi:Glucan endo-1,3-alpha-glucosidase agn1 [Rhodosporidiobolus nylandii]